MTEKSRLILEAIAKGHSYEQILVQELAWTYHDIFAAAAEALNLERGTPTDAVYSVAAIRQDHAQAYVKWDEVQDEELGRLYRAGHSVEEIARLMERQPGGIRSRLAKLGLGGPGIRAEPS
jgi:DNA-directed RNA polymerase specialized sigma24 family protein